MSDDLPNGWLNATGDQLFSFVTSGSRGWARYYADNGPRFLRVGNLNRDAIAVDLKEVQCVRPPSDSEGTRTRVASGDILVSITADLGMVGVVQDGLGDAYVSQHLALARPRPGLFSPFIAWYLASKDGGQAQFSQMDRGAIKAGLSLDDIRSVVVPLPPLAEQRRIVAKVEALLAEVNAARERLAKVPAILKRFRQSVLAAACSGRLTEDCREPGLDSEPIASRLEDLEARRQDLWKQRASRHATAKSRGKYRPGFSPDPPSIELPSAWAWVSVSQLSLADVGFAFPSTEFAKEGIPLLRGENTAPGRLRWDDVRYWPKDKLSGLERLLVDGGDIILGMDRPIIAAGIKLARASATDVPCLLVQRVMRLKTVEPDTAAYLYFALLDGRFQKFLQHDGMTGSDLPHITGTGVAEFPVALPSIAEQREIIRRVDALFNVADVIEKHIAAATGRADRITQAILAKAFRGELVPTEAELAREEGCEYEPASVLAEGIAREREAARSAKPNNRPKRGTAA